MLSIENETLLHTSKLQFLVTQLHESLNKLSLEFTKHTKSKKTRNIIFVMQAAGIIADGRFYLMPDRALNILQLCHDFPWYGKKKL